MFIYPFFQERFMKTLTIFILMLVMVTQVSYAEVWDPGPMVCCEKPNGWRGMIGEKVCVTNGATVLDQSECAQRNSFERPMMKDPVKQEAMAVAPFDSIPGFEEFESESKIEYKEKNLNFGQIKPEFFIVNKMIEGLDPGSVKAELQNCPDTEKMVDAVIAKLKEAGRWDVKSVCDSVSERALYCVEKSKTNCENIRKGWTMHNLDCASATEEDLYNKCIEQSQSWNKGTNTENYCERTWQQREPGCTQRVSQCEERIAQMEIQRNERLAQCEERRSAEGATEEMYNQCVANAGPASVVSCPEDRYCSRDTFMAECQGKVQTNKDATQARMESMCREKSTMYFANFQKQCEQKEFAVNRCQEATQQHCGPVQQALERCKGVTEDQIRAVMIEHGRRLCKFQEFRGKDEVVGKLLEVRGEFGEETEVQLAVDEEAEDLVEVKEEVEEIENKGVGYRFRRFVGLAAEQERQDATKLDESAAKLRESSQLLRDLAETSESTSAASVLLEQAINLENEAESLEALADEKVDRANGIWSIFTGSDEPAEEAE